MTELSDEALMFMGIGLLVMGVVGFSICLLETYAILRQRIIHPFKYFCLSHAAVHGSAQLIVVSLFISTQLITEQWMNPSVIGYTAIALQFCSLYTSFAMSLNRVLSVSVPISYSSMFTKRNTITIALTIWVFSFATTAILLIDSCSFKFSKSQPEFAFTKSDCGRFISKYIDIIYNIALVVVVIPIDIISVILLQRFCKKRAEDHRRLRKERPWFVQTLANSVLFAFMLTCFHTAGFFEDPLKRFLLTTVVWEVWLISPQILILILQKESRNVYAELFFCSRKEPVEAWPAASSTTARFDFHSRHKAHGFSH